MKSISFVENLATSMPLKMGEPFLRHVRQKELLATERGRRQHQLELELEIDASLTKKRR